LYALRLAQAQLAANHVTVLCAEYDPARDHGHVTWRLFEGLPVVEIVNNWRCASFEETYRPPLIGDRIRQLLQVLGPDVVHVHNLLNLSFDLPAIAAGLGIPVVATLHDYTMLCASGGQRVHKRDEHVCVEIDTARCARCFMESPFHSQMGFARFASNGHAMSALARGYSVVRRHMPALGARAARSLTAAAGLPVTPQDLDRRLAAARAVFPQVDLFVAPSAALAREYQRFGMDPGRIEVSDYGCVTRRPAPARAPRTPIRIGLVGTLVWHKGVHVLVDALKTLPAESYRATIFGSLDTFPDYVATLRASAAGLPIEFAGGFEAGRASDIYDAIDVLVVPSLWPENSPLVIHEAFQAGVPVVGSNIGGIPDLVEDGVSGLVFETGSAADLARALRALVTDPPRVGRMSAATPRVKAIAEDAKEWAARYARVTRTRVKEAGASDPAGAT